MHNIARTSDRGGPSAGEASGATRPRGRERLRKERPHGKDPIEANRLWALEGPLAHLGEALSKRARWSGCRGGLADGGAAKGGVGEDLLDSSEQSSGCCHTRKDSRPISFETQIPCLLMCSRLWPCGYIRARGPYEPVFYCMLNLILSTLRILGPDLMSSQPSEPTSSHEFLTLQTRS